MLSRDANLGIFARAVVDADVAIVEGVMGLYDGYDGKSASGSTAEVARWLGAPVLLVADASGMARSAAALVRGFESLDPEGGLRAVPFNRGGGRGHYELLRDAVAACCRARPVGYLEPRATAAIPDRHLGLVLAEEVLTPALVAELASWIES